MYAITHAQASVSLHVENARHTAILNIDAAPFYPSFLRELFDAAVLYTCL